MVTDVEVFQEILRRYMAIGRPEAIEPAFQILIDVTDQIMSIDAADIFRAKEIVLGAVRVSVRDSLHLAVMERHGIFRVMSFDQGFDSWSGVTRVGTI